MKIAIVMPTHFGDSMIFAGGERYAYSLASALSKKHPVTLFTFGPKELTYQEGSLEIRRIRMLFGIGGIANPVAFSFLNNLKDYDVIHCMQFPTIVTELAAITGAWNKKKVFYTDLSGGTSYSLSAMFPIWKCFKEMLLISKFNQKHNRNYPLPCRIIYGGVDELKFKPAAEMFKEPEFLFVGRIFRAKGIHHAIAALPRNASLRVVGTCHDPNYEVEIKMAAKDKSVFFMPGISDHELIDLYHHSLATVLPSLSDGGFTSAMESMACGIPVIATAIGSLPEIIEDGVTGFLVPPNCPELIREKMLVFMKDPERAHTMGRNARNRILEKFTWDKVAQACLQAYQQ